MGDTLQRLGLIVNPHAGHGTAANLRAARGAVEALRPGTVVTGSGALGARAIADWGGVVEVCATEAAAGRAQTLHLARAIISRRVEALVVVGGDGTLADVAQVCIEQPVAPPLIGIGAGSTNAGRLITCRADAAAALDLQVLQPQTVDAVLASCNGELLGPGFNDGVIGFTVVGTLAGQLRDIDAAERMHGRNVPGTPRPIGRPGTKVTRSGPDGSVLVAQGEAVGTVVVGFAEGAFFGKAVTGGVCLAALVGLPAGCLVCDQPIVRVELDAPAMRTWPPIVSHFVGLDEMTRIHVEGARAGAVVCADGNPLRVLGPDDRVGFAIRRAAVAVLRPRE